MEANYPYDIKNQRGASKIPPNWGILRSKAPSRGLWMPELVLYGIRLLSKQLPGTVLDIEADHSVCQSEGRGVMMNYVPALLSHRPSILVMSTITQRFSYPTVRQTSTSVL